MKSLSECLQIFAASCQEPLPLAAHPESLVMCISQADENWMFQCSSLL